MIRSPCITNEVHNGGNEEMKRSIMVQKYLLVLRFFMLNINGTSSLYYV